MIPSISNTLHNNAEYIILCIVLLNVVMLSFVMLIVVVLSVIMPECRYAYCRCDECRVAPCRLGLPEWQQCCAWKKLRQLINHKKYWNSIFHFSLPFIPSLLLSPPPPISLFNYFYVFQLSPSLSLSFIWCLSIPFFPKSPLSLSLCVRVCMFSCFSVEKHLTKWAEKETTQKEGQTERERERERVEKHRNNGRKKGREREK